MRHHHKVDYGFGKSQAVLAALVIALVGLLLFGKTITRSEAETTLSLEGEQAAPAENSLTIDTTITQQQKLTASDGAANDLFGSSVSVHQDTAVIGAPGDGLSQGSAHVFFRLGGTWFGPQKLIADDGKVDDHFGASVAITENTVVVGADGDNQGRGAAYVFTRSSGSWTQQQKLTASDGVNDDAFGVSVAINGDAIVVGAKNDNVGASSNRGSAYVFTRSGTTWTQQAKLEPSDGASDDEFGVSVAMSGNTVVVGSHLDDMGAIANQGSAYVYVRSGATWSQQQKLTVSSGAADDAFGNAVAISGDSIVVGANLDDVGGNSNEGSAHVFTRSGTTWSFDQTLNGSDTNTGDRFGNSVAISGDSIVVGALFAEVSVGVPPGAAYLFFNIDSTWSERVKLTASDGAPVDELGVAVALEGNTVIVGSALDDVGAVANQGSAYIFPCLEQVRLTASDGVAGDRFGETVAIDGDTAIVASPGDDSAYVFVRSGATWSQQAKLSGDDGVSGGVALDGNTALVGRRVYVRSGTTWTLQDTLLLGGPVRDVAIDGNTAVVGNFSGGPFNTGRATFFVRSGTTWTEQDNLIVSGNSSFGTSVAISGNTAIIGAIGTIFPTLTGGAAYIYVRSGTTWTQQQVLSGSGISFGKAVSISGNTALVGGGDIETGGTATVYFRSGTDWSLQEGLSKNDDPPSLDGFGTSVSINGNTAIASDPGEDVGTDLQGAVYLFTRNGTNWERQRFLTANDESVRFGESISINNNTILVGDPEAEIGANAEQGAAYIFFDACNNAPIIVPNSSVELQQDDVATLTIATVSDAQDFDDDLTVTLAAPISSTISLTNITNTDGTITAKISATCAAALGNNPVTLRVEDSHGATSTAILMINVTCPTISVNPSTIPAGTGGEAYSQAFTQTGCNTSATFSLTGTLPAGLSFNGATGVLSGTPTQVGFFPIIVRATNSDNCTGSRPYILRISPSFLIWDGSSSSNWHTAANWNRSVTPQPYHLVVIPAGVIPNEPVIGSNSSTINGMTVETGRTLTINAMRQLTAEADISNSGQIQGAGKLICEGALFIQDGATSVASVEFAPGSHVLQGTGAFQSNTVTVSSGANVTLATDHSLSGLLIDSGGSFDIRNRTLTVTGAGMAISNQGSFIPLNSTIVYEGTAAQLLTSNIDYVNLTINNPAGVLTTGSTGVSGLLTLMTDLTGNLVVPSTGTSAGPGDVIGTVTRGSTFAPLPLNTTLIFGNLNNTIRFTSGIPPDQIMVRLEKSRPFGFTGTVTRNYTITYSGSSNFVATTKLRYKDAETTGLNEATFELWRFNGASWESPLGVATRDTTANWVEEAGITAFSPWTITSPPGPVTCSYSLSPSSMYLPARGGGASFNINALAGCFWFVESAPSWIEIVSDTSGSGNGIISFEARDNFTASARQGTISVGGQTIAVVQEGRGTTCSYTVSPLFATYAVGGRSGSISLTTQAQCGWQATSNQSWIVITSAGVGIGGGSVNYTVSPNTSGATRDGVITIGGQKIQVKQKGS